VRKRDITQIVFAQQYEKCRRPFSETTLPCDSIGIWLGKTTIVEQAFAFLKPTASMSLNFLPSALFAGGNNLGNLYLRRSFPTFSPVSLSEYRCRNFLKIFLECYNMW